MDTPQVLAHIDRLQREVSAAGEHSARLHGVKAQICEFFRQTAGPKSSFLAMAQNAHGVSGYLASTLHASLENFKSYIQSGLHGAMSPERKAQVDVVSDFLEQAQHLLNGKGVHPAAPIVLIGATLEEFLRGWVESAGLSLGQRKPSLESYGQVLLAEELITKQDMKDVTAWAGLRNHAAHGEWEAVADKQRASIMLDGVNLFLRKYASE
jgi:hypothetical protein